MSATTILANVIKDVTERNDAAVMAALKLVPNIEILNGDDIKPYDRENDYEAILTYVKLNRQYFTVRWHKQPDHKWLDGVVRKGYTIERTYVSD